MEGWRLSLGSSSGKGETPQGWRHDLGFLRIGQTCGDWVLGWNSQSEQRSLHQSVAWEWPWGFVGLDRGNIRVSQRPEGPRKYLCLKEPHSLCTRSDIGNPESRLERECTPPTWKCWVRNNLVSEELNDVPSTHGRSLPRSPIARKRGVRVEAADQAPSAMRLPSSR